MGPEEMEEDYLDAGDEEGAGEASFEMQRYAAKAATKNQDIAAKAIAKVHKAGPSARGSPLGQE